MAAAFTTQIALEGEAEATGVRPPSYTDRILSFSLEDKKDFLRQVEAWGRASRQPDRAACPCLPLLTRVCLPACLPACCSW